MKTIHCVMTGAALVGLCALARPALASKDAADLKRELDTQQAAVPDFERLDERHAVTDEITLLKSWLDEGFAQFNKESYDKVREVLDRCIAQQELLRQKINASSLTAQAGDKEAAVKRLRDKIARTRAELQQATINKKAMEMNQK